MTVMQILSWRNTDCCLRNGDDLTFIGTLRLHKQSSPILSVLPDYGTHFLMLYVTLNICRPLRGNFLSIILTFSQFC